MTSNARLNVLHLHHCTLLQFPKYYVLPQQELKTQAFGSGSIVSFNLCRQDATCINLHQECNTRSIMMAMSHIHPLGPRISLARDSCSRSHRCCRLVASSRSRHLRIVTACSSLAFSSPLAAISMAYSSDPVFSSGAEFSPLSSALPTAIAAILAFGLARFLQACYAYSIRTRACLATSAAKSRLPSLSYPQPRRASLGSARSLSRSELALKSQLSS